LIFTTIIEAIINCSGTLKGSTGGGSTSTAVSHLRSPQVERLKSANDKDKGNAQRKQNTSASKTPAKHQNVSDKSATFKYRTKTPNKTPMADRYGVVSYFESSFCAAVTISI